MHGHGASDAGIASGDQGLSACQLACTAIVRANEQGLVGHLMFVARLMMLGLFSLLIDLAGGTSCCHGHAALLVSPACVNGRLCCVLSGTPDGLHQFALLHAAAAFDVQLGCPVIAFLFTALFQGLIRVAGATGGAGGRSALLPPLFVDCAGCNLFGTILALAVVAGAFQDMFVLTFVFLCPGAWHGCLLEITDGKNNVVDRLITSRGRAAKGRARILDSSSSFRGRIYRSDSGGRRARLCCSNA